MARATSFRLHWFEAPRVDTVAAGTAWSRVVPTDPSVGVPSVGATEPNPACRVMLVDDDLVYLTVLARSLRKRGYSVTAYSDPRDAMDHLALDLPAAVITDLRMPHMSGLEVVQEVRARLGVDGPPVLVVSSEDDEETLEAAFRLGATDYLLKPVSETELKVKLQRALRPGRGDSGRLPAFPDRIGDWALEECIGRGGSACVFRATRAGLPGSIHALKVVWPHLLENTETLLRFRREIDTLSSLQHPQLVSLVESGRHEGWFYYVMTYLPGGSLRDRLREDGACDPMEALRLVEEATHPLEFLHERGVVHRDLKPGNLFYDPQGRVVLGDFGLAKHLHDRGITLSEEFVGTPLYLAPEVFRSPRFDQTVDFYALGVCAIELLLGRPPLVETESLRLIATIMEQGLPPAHELVPGIPAPLAALLERMMARAPADRFQTAAELRAAAAEVRRALEG